MRRLFPITAALLSLCTAAQAEGDALAFYRTQAERPAAKVDTSRRAGAPRLATAISRRHLGPAAPDVARLADQMGVPRSLALSVCRVESRCRYGLVGRAGERGPLQIKLQTARGLGYTGTAAGLNGHTGAYWGMRHLATAYRKCGTARGAARLHNSGLAAGCGGSRYASRVVAGL